MRFVLALATLAGLAGGAQAADRISGSFDVDALQGVIRHDFGSSALATPDDHLITVSPADQFRLASRGAGDRNPAGLTHLTLGSLASSQGGERSALSPANIQDSVSVNAVAAAFDGVPSDEQSSAVPDVTSWGLLLGGFSLVGIIARRRRDGRSVSA